MTMYLKIQENLSCTSTPIYRIIEVDKNQEVKYSNIDISVPILVFYLLALKNNNPTLHRSFLKRIDQASCLEDFDYSGYTEPSAQQCDDVACCTDGEPTISFDQLKELFTTWKHKILDANYHTIDYQGKILRYFNLINEPFESVVYVCEPSNAINNNPLEFIFHEAYNELKVNETSKPFYNDIISTFPYLAPYIESLCDQTEITQWDNLEENIKCVSCNGKHYIYCGKAYLLNETGQTVQKL